MALPKFLRKARFAFAYPLVAWLLLTARPTDASMRWAALIILLGEALRLWANGYVGHVKVGRDVAPDRTVIPKGKLITGGPYAFVRHPLYLGTMLLGLGFCVAVNNLWVAAASLVFFLTIYRSKMSEEEQRIREAYPQYTAYERAVPRWIPRFRRYANRTGQWQWKGIAASKEWKTLIWVTVLFILLYFHEEIIEQHEWLARGHQARQLALLTVAVVLALGDVGFELARWRAKRLSVEEGSP